MGRGPPISPCTRPRCARAASPSRAWPPQPARSEAYSRGLSLTVHAARDGPAVRRLVRHADGAGARALGHRRHRLHRREPIRRARAAAGWGPGGHAEGTVIAIVTVFILVCPRQPVHPTSGRHGPTGAASTGPLVTADASFSVCLVLERMRSIFRVAKPETFISVVFGVPRRSTATGVDSMYQ